MVKLKSSLITGFVTRMTRRVSLVEQKLPTLPEHLHSPLVFSGIRVIRSLVEYGTALTTILPILFLYLNTVTVTAGTFEP